jgi:hypothetical protein
MGRSEYSVQIARLMGTYLFWSSQGHVHDIASLQPAEFMRFGYMLSVPSTGIVVFDVHISVVALPSLSPCF